MPDDKVVEAITKLLELLFHYFSPTVVVIFVVAVLLLAIGRKVYNDYRADKKVDEALKAKDETIQIINEQNRQLRVIQLRDRGWSIADIEAVVMKQTPKDPIEARKMIEDGKSEMRSGKLRDDKKTSH